jgi:peptide/nickel transport system permease protein
VSTPPADPVRTPALGPEPAVQPEPELLLPDAGQPGAAGDPAPDEPARRGWREALRLIAGSAPGKLGLAMFAGMLAISLWVLLTYPPNFGVGRWSNPAVWADNPRNAPPAWTARFGAGIPNVAATLGAPTDTRSIAAGEVRTYAVPIDYPGGGVPTALSLTLTGVTFESRPPAVLASLRRPDGGELRLAAVQVTGPRPGEQAPYRRYYDSPERTQLAEQPAAAQSVSRYWTETYPGAAPPTHPMAALFGRAGPDGQGVTPLPGEYVVQVQVVVADPADQIAPMRVTLGGTVFGVMGTDGLGRDLWQGLLYGFPVGLAIAALTSLASTAVGATLGIVSGYRGGWIDAAIQRAADVVSNVPTLPLLIFLVSVLGRHLWLIMAVLVAFSWPGLTILVRSMVLQIRSGQLVEAARALGASRSRIMARHVFPQVAPFVVAQMIFFAPGAILAEASLSFLGLGDPSIPTWGQMLEAGFRTGALYVGYWWWVLPPGILIVVTAVAFMLMAVATEPVVDPRLRRRS